MIFSPEPTNTELAAEMERLADESQEYALSREERAWLRLAAARLRIDHGTMHRDSQAVGEKFREG